MPGRVAVVTGSATGAGRSIADGLTVRGCAASVLPIDLAVPEGAETMVEATLATHGRLDILVSDYRAIAGVLHVPFPTPFDAPTVVTAENHVVGGGLASLVAEALFDAGLIRPMSRIGLPDSFIECGSVPGLQQKYRLNVTDITQAALGLLDRRGRER